MPPDSCPALVKKPSPSRPTATAACCTLAFSYGGMYEVRS
jgi:hypothetical protein